MTAMQVSEQRVNQLEAMHLFYCNEVYWRCSNPRCRDCSTAVADILNASGANVAKCSTSFSLAQWCFNAERPDWFSKLFGYNLPGTFISRADAEKYACIGLSGSNWGINADSNGHGHVEYILGRGNLTWGAHSHSTGVGFDSNGLNNHSLDYFAIPPHFLPFMKPGPVIDWEKLKELIEWHARVAQPRKVNKDGRRVLGTLRRGDRGKDVLIMRQLLVKTGYMRAKPDAYYGIRTARAVRRYKVKNGWPKNRLNGNLFGKHAATSILK